MRRGAGLALLVLLLLLVVGGSLLLQARAVAAATCDTTGSPTMTVYLPNITKTLGGASGWVTPFIVQNVGTVATTLEVSFYRFSDGGLVTCRKIGGLLPYRSFADVPNNDTDLPSDSQFAVVVRSFGAQIVSVVNEHQGAGATAEALSYVGLSSGSQTQALPYVAKRAGGWLVTFVMQNLGTANANVTARFTSYDGTKTATLTRVVAPGASRFVDPTVEPLLIAGTEYSVLITSDQPVAAIANSHNDAPGSVAPMGFSYNAVVASSTAQQYVPSVQRNGDGVGRTTRVVIQNAGPGDATPSLLFQRAGVTPLRISAPLPVKPSAAWTFDPRFFADGQTACPASGAPNCLAEGEWSLVVSGGQFAVLAIATSAATALGYIGTAAPGNRAYLPNVTRTLGGASGWTTPIVVQSAGATAGTLRWYRFADGTLVTRQPLSGLADGLAVRVDPRTVPGLADDTQYAVVLDVQNGSAAAIVTELSFLGGDGAMAYEGFKATVSTAPLPTMLSVTAAKTNVFNGTRVPVTAVVLDQFDNPMNLAVSWSVMPSTLGTVSGAGLFAAAESGAGVATVTATFGGLSASAAITVAERPTATVGGITFQIDGTGAADVYTEIGITGAAASTIASQVDTDVAQIQSDYGRAYDSRSRLYIFASTPSYTNGLQTIFGYDPSLAQTLSTSAGIYSTGLDAVAIDWSKVSADVPLGAARHELTHRMEHQIAGFVDLPAWFNEGNARGEEYTITGNLHSAVLGRYDAASMAATGTLLSLADMTSQTAWNARPGQAGTYQYYEAAELVRLIRDRVSAAGVIRILELMGAGEAFEAAYADVAAESFATFAASYPARLRAVAPSYPGITTAPDTVAGPGLSIVFYGFAPGSQMTYTVTGPGASSAPRTVAVSAYGTASTYLDQQWPAGTYSVTATYAGGSVSATGVKTSSLAFASPVALTPDTGTGSIIFDLPDSAEPISGR